MNRSQKTTTCLSLILFCLGWAVEAVEITQKSTGRALDVIVLELSETSVTFSTKKDGPTYQVGLDQLTAESVERLSKLSGAMIKKVINKALRGQAWIDTNADSKRDTSERPVVDMVMKLYLDHNRDGIPERCIGTTRTDAEGGYTFSISVAGHYQVGIDLLTAPEEVYQISRLAAEADPVGNDFSPDTLRTRVLAIETDLAGVDVGLLETDPKAQFLGLHTAEAGPVKAEVQRWVYKDIALSIEHLGGEVDERAHLNATRWLKWYKQAETVFQEALVKDNFLSEERFPDNHYEEWLRGKKHFEGFMGNNNLGSGPTSSAQVPSEDIHREPENVSLHRILFYEGIRGANPLFEHRGFWPPNGCFSHIGVGDISIMGPHLLTAVTMYEVGGEDAITDINGQYGNVWNSKEILVDGLKNWRRARTNYLDAFASFESPKSKELRGSIFYGSGLASSFLFHIYLEYGKEKFIETLINLSQQKVAGSPEEAVHALTRSFADALGQEEVKKLWEDHHMPFIYDYDSDRGLSTGNFEANVRDVYRWDFAPHGIADDDILPEYSLFSERTREGFFLPDRDVEHQVAGSFFYQDSKYQLQYVIAGETRSMSEDSSFVIFSGGLAHRVKNGRWKVSFQGRIWPSDLNNIFAEGLQMTPSYTHEGVSEWVEHEGRFEVVVTDGELNLRFPNIEMFNLVLERVGDE